MYGLRLGHILNTMGGRVFCLSVFTVTYLTRVGMWEYVCSDSV